MEAQVGKLILFERTHWIECLGLLMPRPLRGPDRRERLDVAPFKAFQKVWAAVEKRVTNGRLLTYLFKYLVDTIYTHRNTLPVEKVARIKTAFLNEFTRLVNSFIPEINYNILIESTVQMASEIEKFFANALKTRVSQLYEFYACLPFNEDNCDDYIWKAVEGAHMPPVLDAQIIEEIQP